MSAELQQVDANGKTALRVVSGAGYSLLPSNPGLSVTCTSANTDYPTAIPAGAKYAVVWFEDSGGSIISGGRVHITNSASAIATLTGSDTLMSYSPSVPTSYPIPAGMGYIHLANSAAGSKARVSFFQ